MSNIIIEIWEVWAGGNEYDSKPTGKFYATKDEAISAGDGDARPSWSVLIDGNRYLLAQRAPIALLKFCGSPQEGALRKAAMEKLTPAERKALGLEAKP